MRKEVADRDPPPAFGRLGQDLADLGRTVAEDREVPRHALAQQAFDQLNPHPYRTFTEPVVMAQPMAALGVGKSYVNCVLDTALPARELLNAMLEIEREAGRARSADGSDRWGPRTLDLDLLLYAQASILEPGLQVPHPHLHQRAFALVPLLEIAPQAMIPGIGAADSALARIAPDEVRALAADEN